MNADTPAPTFQLDDFDGRIAAIERGEAANVEAALTDAITVYRGLAVMLTSLEARQKRAKRIVADILTETGMTKISTPAGIAYLTADSQTVSYDAKALDALCKSSPELTAILTPHRKETVRMGTLTIK